MSTTAVIVFEDEDQKPGAYVLVKSDGYPESVGRDLREFLHGIHFTNSELHYMSPEDRALNFKQVVDKVRARDYPRQFVTHRPGGAQRTVTIEYESLYSILTESRTIINALDWVNYRYTVTRGGEVFSGLRVM